MTKIPKKIHYCWFGGNPLPEDQKKYIDAWKKKCPDYEIKEWNEKNFDVNSNRYVKEAYEAKKFAFVSDYARLHALYTEGGIYLDTDIEILKSFDSFLAHEAFIGYEDTGAFSTATIGAKKKNKWIKLLLSEYDNISFYKEDGEMDLTTNVQRIHKKTKEIYKLNSDLSYQELDNLTIYPYEFFCAKNWLSGEIESTENTCTIHHFKGSWHSKKQRNLTTLGKNLSLIFGNKLGKKLYKIICVIDLVVHHPIKSSKKVIKKLKGSIKK